MQCEMVQNYKFKKVKAKNILLAFNAMQKKKDWKRCRWKCILYSVVVFVHNMKFDFHKVPSCHFHIWTGVEIFGKKYFEWLKLLELAADIFLKFLNIKLTGRRQDTDGHMDAQCCLSTIGEVLSN